MTTRKFPKGWPDFTADQRAEFKQLELYEEQVDALRFALAGLHKFLNSTPPRNEVKSLLGDIEDLSRKLSDKLAALINVPDAAHAAALKLIEQGYWDKRPEDEGGMVAVHLCPRLHALEDSAREARATLPRTPARHATSDPALIAEIDHALHEGWQKRHGSNAIGTFWCDPDDDLDQVLESRIDERSKMPRATPYPSDKLRPKTSEGRKENAFREVVRICFEAAGYKRFPKRALQAFVKGENDTRKSMLLAVENALSGREPRDG